MSYSTVPIDDTSDWDALAYLVELPDFRDERGALYPCEFPQLPFVPCRSFHITSAPAKTARGGHSHIRQRQLIFCISGALQIELRCRHLKTNLTLKDPKLGLLLEPSVWSSQTFESESTVALVLANGPYDPADYRFDY